MSPLRYLTGRTSPTHRSLISRGVKSLNVENPRKASGQSSAALPLADSAPIIYHFSRVQMWMCDEINVAQVKRAGEGTARPHGSLSAHMQILKFTLHKKFECQYVTFICVYLQFSAKEDFFFLKKHKFVLLTAIALILHMKHC